MTELCGGKNTTSTTQVCATFYNGRIPACSRPSPSTAKDNGTLPSASSTTTLAASDVVVAVKTYRGFHASRIPVVKKTWEREVLFETEAATKKADDDAVGVNRQVSSESPSHLIYFSDLVDERIPTKDLGVENTKRGHCAKTMAILQYYAKEVQ